LCCFVFLLHSVHHLFYILFLPFSLFSSAVAFSAIYPAFLQGSPPIQSISLVLHFPFKLILIALYGPLAQLVEQWTFNPLVPRSSRGRLTILCLECFLKHPLHYFDLLSISCYYMFTLGF